MPSDASCDNELIEFTDQHKLYKEQARYCVARQSPELWARVLSPGNVYMKFFSDAVISTAIPECDDPDKVSQTIKAFIDEVVLAFWQLLDLLEKVVMESPIFQNNTSLQNLLIVTAIKADTSRIMAYVTRLNDYTWDKICDHFIQAHLYDEAITAYKKFGQNVEAFQVKLTYNKNIKAALDWAHYCDKPAVWVDVARAQLSAGQVVDAIDSFIKAKNPSEYNQIIKVDLFKQLPNTLFLYLIYLYKRVLQLKLRKCILQMHKYHLLSNTHVLTKFLVRYKVLYQSDLLNHLFHNLKELINETHQV